MNLFLHLNTDFLQFVAHFGFFWTVSLLFFDFIERPGSPRLIDATYPSKMRWYKILARILLMFSIIDFALAAPVVVQERGVRVSVVDPVKDETVTSALRRDPSDKWPANAADWTNEPPIPRSLDSRPGQHNPRQRGSNGSPAPSNPAPSIDSYGNNPLRVSPPPLRHR